MQNGWSWQGEYTYSPVLTDIQTFPYYQYDEWYVFECQTLLDNIEVFINYWGFSLAYVDNFTDAGNDQAGDSRPWLIDAQSRFWQQLERFVPESYLAEGDNLIFVTRNQQLFEQILRWKNPRQEY